MAYTAQNFSQCKTFCAAVCPYASFSAYALLLDAVLASIFAIFSIGLQKHTT